MPFKKFSKNDSASEKRTTVRRTKSPVKRISKEDTEEKSTDQKRVLPMATAPMYNDGMLNIAIKAAREAAKIQLRAFYRGAKIEISEKSSGDFVTDVDKASEAAIVQIISEAFPDHKFLGEETGSTGQDESEYLWIIDPIDGTKNFINGIDQFCVSIACQKGKHLLHAVVFNPVRNELFTATRGKGALLDGRRIRVSGASILRHSLIGTGFPFREDDDYSGYLKIMAEMMQKTAGLRRPGSAALDLCWLACGRYDGFWEKGIKIWDIAAGALIAQEAGALLTDFSGETDFLTKGEIIGATPRIFPQMLSIILKATGK
ncbi:MAG: inositol monophosphatase [Burkholderiales bacterium]|nr:inositol monophosphatase [Burkholderiales bacterium]